MLKFKTDWPRKSLYHNVLSPVLTGDRVVLKPPALADYNAWSDIRAQNKYFLTPYEPQWSDDALTREFFIRRLKRQDQERDAGRGAYFLLHDKTTHQIIGGLNLNNIQMGAARHATLGYWLGEEYQGQGYMSETINLMIDFAFNTLKLKRLNAACLTDNTRSIHMLMRLGFEEEGLAKAYLQINGRWQDHRLFGLCASSKG